MKRGSDHGISYRTNQRQITASPIRRVPSPNKPCGPTTTTPCRIQMFNAATYTCRLLSRSMPHMSYRIRETKGTDRGERSICTPGACTFPTFTPLPRCEDYGCASQCVEHLACAWSWSGGGVPIHNPNPTNATYQEDPDAPGKPTVRTPQSRTFSLLRCGVRVLALGEISVPLVIKKGRFDWDFCCLQDRFVWD